jgi:hypothetical protein
MLLLLVEKETSLVVAKLKYDYNDSCYSAWNRQRGEYSNRYIDAEKAAATLNETLSRELPPLPKRFCEARAMRMGFIKEGR